MWNFHLSNRIKSILSNVLLMMLLYSLSRLSFYLLNTNSFASFGHVEILKMFFIGLRFDLSVVVLLSGPYILLNLIPFTFYYRKAYQIFLRLVFLVSHLPIFILHLADAEYFKFTGTRMTTGLTALGSEIKNQLDQFIVNYWHISLLSIGCCVLAYKLFSFATPSKAAANMTSKNGSALRFSLGGFILIALSVIAVRGGLQKKVLQPSYAFTIAEDHLGILALNSSFTILKTSSRDHVDRSEYFATFEDATAVIPKPKYPLEDLRPKQNVVILILESFATEFWGVANNGEGYTPFLDSLARKGLFFRNHFANGRRSIEALPSIVFGLPSLMDHPLAKSRFQFNTWHGIGDIVKRHNYHTSFFHAAEHGSMYFDAVAKLAGLDAFYPLESYPNPEDSDGHWGIFDEPFLQFMISELSKSEKPFLSVGFSLSSHQPYPIPAQHVGKFKKGPTPLHECIGYVDYAVEQFFKEAQKQDWYNDTLFIITADHTQMSPSVDYDTTLGRYMVPLLVYHPSIELKANTDKVVHHADILPSVLDFLDIENEPTNLFGRSIFQNDEGRALFQLNGKYFLVKNGMASEYDKNTGTFTFFGFDDPNKAKVVEPEISIRERMKQELLAFIQYFNNGLLDNRLYDWAK